MSYQRRWAVTATTALLFAIAACGSADTTSETGAPAAQAGFPVTIQNCGRTLTFDRPPSRVLTITHGLDTLIELGTAGNVIGRTITPLDDELPQRYTATYDAVEVVSEGAGLPSKEELLALRPDLVIGSYYADFDPSEGRATRDDLDAVGVKSYVMANQCDPAGVKAYTLDKTYADVQNLGAIFGAREKADEVVNTLKARVAEVDQWVAGREPVRVVTLDATEKVLYGPGGGIYDEVTKHAGGVNRFDGGADGYAEVSVEEVAAANAEAYVVINYGPDTTEQRIARIAAIAPASPGVQNNRYAVIQNNEMWVGPRVVDAVEKVAKALHPEAFQ